MAINILVIDDDKRMAIRLMNNLKRADQSNILGSIEVDDSIKELETVEKYDVSHYGIKFDVALIDYQLSCSFTGILVSAWIALDLQIPRLTLTTAAYPGNPDYFNGAILKNEITDSPRDIIQRISDCVEDYNADLWLAKQHQALVLQYQALLRDEEKAGSHELSSVEALLDRFEKIIDSRQEKQIKKILMYEREKNGFIERQKENEKRLSALYLQLNRYLEEAKND